MATRYPALRGRIIAVLLVAAPSIVVGALGGVSAARFERARIAKLRRTDLEALADDVSSNVRSRVERYQYGLRGMRGAVLVAGSDLSRERVLTYADARDFAREFPGALGFGFVRRVSPDALNDFLDRARLDRPDGFNLRSFARHDHDHMVIQYIVPEARNRPAIGLDLASDPVREQAGLTAARTGEPTLTAPITLVQATDPDARGALFFLPVYRTATTPPPRRRDELLVGWAYAPLDLPAVLRCENQRCEDYTIEVNDVAGGRGVLAFRSPTFRSGAPSEITVVRDVAVFGRVWRIAVQSTAAFDAHDHSMSPKNVGALTATGVSLATALAIIALLYLRRWQRSQQELRASEQRFRDMAQSVALMVWTSDRDGKLTYVSPQWTAYSGKDEQSSLGDGWLDQLHPDDRAAVEREWAIANGTAYEGQFRIRRADGEHRWFQARAVPSKDRSGVAQRWYGSNTDIQDLRDAHASLHALNDELEQRVDERTSELARATALQRGILSAAGSAIIGTDLRGTITVWNHAAERLLGYTSSEVVATQTLPIIHDESELAAHVRALRQSGVVVETDFAAIVHAVRDGANDAREWTLRRKDGSAVPVLLTLSGIRDERGAVLGYLGVAVDLTAQHKVATELAALNRLLEDRTAQAESASKAKSVFVASMSHEIRTPMNAVSGATFLLERTELTPSQRDLVATIRTASSALLSMLNDVLDVSKIEAGQLALLANPFRLRATIADMASMLGGLARDKSLAFEVRVDDTLGDRWIGDKTRLTQILTNLLGNAIKFTAKGRVSLNVTRATAEKMSLRFVVSDTGRGIPADAIPRLFTPYYQVPSASTPTGTGLGLAIVRTLSELMGGRVTVQSQLGEGTTFVVELPLEPDATRESSREMQSLSAQQHTPPVRQLADCAVLVVDDHPTNLKIAKAILESEGALVTTAGSAAEALRLLREDPARFRVVLMDIQMPEMSGVEATSAIRSDAKLAKIPVIAFSAGATEEERAAAVRAGMNGFVAKPVDPDMLISLVCDQMTVAQPQQEQRAPATDETRNNWVEIDGISAAEASPRMGGSFELFCELLPGMLEEAGDPRALVASPESLDFDAIRHEVHRIRGAAASMAANDLARECSAAETAAQRRDAAKTIEAVTAVAREVDRIRRSFERVAKRA